MVAFDNKEPADGLNFNRWKDFCLYFGQSYILYIKNIFAVTISASRVCFYVRAALLKYEIYVTK